MDPLTRVLYRDVYEIYLTLTYASLVTGSPQRTAAFRRIGTALYGSHAIDHKEYTSAIAMQEARFLLSSLVHSLDHVRGSLDAPRAITRAFDRSVSA